MYDRFDHEQQIMKCWSVVDDLKDLQEFVLESDLSKDQICNILMGMSEMYQHRFDKLFRTFEASIRDNPNFSPRPNRYSSWNGKDTWEEIPDPPF
jgi:uncharacterized protein YeeX (DUF496 family)